MKEEDEARWELEQCFGQRLSDTQWEFLVNKRYVDEIMGGERSAREISQELKEWWAVMGGGPRGAESTKPQMLARDQAPAADEKERRRFAVSKLLALEAEKDGEVSGFRDTHLAEYPDHRLPWAQMEAWIREQARKDGAPTTYAEVPLPPGCEIRLDSGQGAAVFSPELRVPAVPGGISTSAKFLKYGTPDQDYLQAVPTRAGSVLDRLRQTSARLSRRYSWTPDQATVLVLTGLVPLFSLARITRAYKAALPVTSRIEISVDPMTTAEELAEYYRVFRQRLMPKRRYRPLDEKHTELALFAAGREEAEPWQVTVRAWNELVSGAHPDWVYTEAQKANFKRDVNQARERLLYPPYVDPSTGQAQKGAGAEANGRDVRSLATEEVAGV